MTKACNNIIGSQDINEDEGGGGEGGEGGGGFAETFNDPIKESALLLLPHREGNNSRLLSEKKFEVPST